MQNAGMVLAAVLPKGTPWPVILLVMALTIGCGWVLGLILLRRKNRP